MISSQYRTGFKSALKRSGDWSRYEVDPGPLEPCIAAGAAELPVKLRVDAVVILDRDADDVATSSASGELTGAAHRHSEAAGGAPCSAEPTARCGSRTGVLGRVAHCCACCSIGLRRIVCGHAARWRGVPEEVDRIGFVAGVLVQYLPAILLRVADLSREPEADCEALRTEVCRGLIICHVAGADVQ